LDEINLFVTYWGDAQKILPEGVFFGCKMNANAVYYQA